MHQQVILFYSVVGNMVYDPKLKIWQGNDEEMDVFEEKIAKKSTKPTLITTMSDRDYKSGIYGGMVFDPVHLVWTGNEDQEDAHIFDDIVSFETSTSFLLLI
jgi:hypothetical protein